MTDPTTPGSLRPYDAVLLLSFGGPDEPDDVMPFLRNVTRGRGIPEERLASVATHYRAAGGRSPINDQNRALLSALRVELGRRGLEVPVVWGNRNWTPYVVDALREAHRAGARRLLTLVTSAYPSYSGCRQYREDLADALGLLAGDSILLQVDKVRHYANHPGFVSPMVDGVLDALAGMPETALPETALPQTERGGARLVFVTHSIPTAMNASAGPDGDGYLRWHLDVAETIADQAGPRCGRRLDWDLAFCSRSGPPTQPWLEPDINDHLRALAESAVPGVVVVPIGFVSDHLEVIHDLDTEAAGTAAELRLPFARARTVGTDPRFVAALVDLLLERAAAERGDPVERPAAGTLGPSHDVCPAGCCRNLRGPRPAACGLDAPVQPTAVIG